MEQERELGLGDYLTPKQFSAKYPAFPPNCLRRLLFHRETNGLHECVKKVGAKVYISQSGFL